jgi:hypothetical protein
MNWSVKSTKDADKGREGRRNGLVWPILVGSGVTRLNEEGGEITIRKTADKPQFLIYPYSQADAYGDDLFNAHRVSVAQFAAKATSWQTILRYEGAPVVLEVNSIPQAVIKVHPEWRSQTIESARKRVQMGQRDGLAEKGLAQKVDTMSAQLDEVLGLLKKHFK